MEPGNAGKETAYGGTREFFSQLIRFAPRRAASALLLLLLQGATEGISLLLLVPFLELVVQPDGIAAGTGGDGTSRVAQAVGGIFEALHLPMTLTVVLFSFVGLVLLRSLLVMQSEVTLTRIQVTYVDHLRTRLFTSIGSASWAHLVRSRLTDATQGIGQDIFRIGKGVRASLDLMAASSIVVAYAVVAITLSPLTTLAALTIGAVLELIRVPILRHSRELGQAVTTVNRTTFAILSEFMQGLKLIKARGLGPQHRAEFVAAIADIRERRLRFSRSLQRAHCLHQVALAAALTTLIYLAVRFDVRYSELLVVIFVFGKLLPMLSRVHQQVRVMSESLPAYRATIEMFEGFERHAEPPEESADALESLPLCTGLELRGVSFTYEEESQPAVADIDLTIPAFETVGIVGPSGAGKTTLVDLVLGLLVPQSGAVLLDGAPLVGTRRLAWRRSVAYLPQETFLLHDSIRANLNWMAPNASEEDMWTALGSAAAAAFVRRLPEGLDTMVGERGAKLSGGQRQRIALARAILTSPQLFVLDEATSQIDTRTELQITRAIDELQGRATILIIGHRASILSRAQRLILIEDGRVRDAGTAAAIREDPERPLHQWMLAHGGFAHEPAS